MHVACLAIYGNIDHLLRCQGRLIANKFLACEIEFKNELFVLLQEISEAFIISELICNQEITSYVLLLSKVCVDVLWQQSIS